MRGHRFIKWAHIEGEGAGEKRRTGGHISKAILLLQVFWSELRMYPCLHLQVYEPGVLMQKWAQLCSRRLHMWATERKHRAR